MKPTAAEAAWAEVRRQIDRRTRDDGWVILWRGRDIMGIAPDDVKPGELDVLHGQGWRIDRPN